MQPVPSPQSQTLNPAHDLSARGLVADIDHFAVHDGPGIRTAVFLKGCPLGCIWCHSPETQSAAPQILYLSQKCNACGLCLTVCEPHALTPVEEGGVCRVAVNWELCSQCGACAAVCYAGALKVSGTWMSAAEVLEQVLKDQPFYAASGGGVTLSGGEATAQAAFSTAFLASCHAAGIHTALETNGCAPWPVFEQLAPVVDLFLYDIKHMDDARHRELTGVSNRLALSNLRRLADLGANIIVRVPCIPGLNDDPANIAATAAWTRQAGLSQIHLLPYNTSAGAKYTWLGQAYTLPGQPAQPSEDLDRLAAICRTYGLTAQVEGRE
jgi:pyruvate formate lyase activating enzyme